MSSRANKQELVLEFQRIRHVKPQFFSHEGLYEAEIKAGVPVRLGFVGLWTCCDKHGRFEWKPRQLKLKTLPYDEIDFNKVLEALVDTDSIRKYEVDGKQYGYIPSWRKHQYISPKELRVKSQFPAPPGVVDSPETEDVPESDEIAPGPGRVVTETVSEPGQAVSVGIGVVVGERKESQRNVAAATGIAKQQPPLHNCFSSSNDNSSATASLKKITRFHHPDYDLDPDSWRMLSDDAKLANIFYDLLPLENQQAAPVQWERLWSEDLETLNEGSWELMKDVLLYASRKKDKEGKRFYVRMDSVVKNWERLKTETMKIREKGKPVNGTSPVAHPPSNGQALNPARAKEMMTSREHDGTGG